MAGLTFESALLAAIMLVLIGLLSVSFASRPASAIPLLLLVEMVGISSIPQEVMVGQLHVYPGDIITVALAAATLMRWQQRGDAVRPTRPLVVLLAILLLSMARGVAAFGLQPSVVAARQILLMLAAAIFFSTVRVTPQLVRAVRNWLLLASAVLILVAVDFWLQHGFGTYAATGSRALDSLQALFVLETTIIIVVFPPFRGQVLRWVVPLTGFVVVVLSVQRTVWAAGLVAAAVLVVARPRSRGSTSIAGRRILIAAAVLAVGLLVAAGPPGVTSSLTAGYQQTSVTQNSTFSWRLQGWSALINRQRAGPSRGSSRWFTKWNRKREHQRGCLSARCPQPVRVDLHHDRDHRTCPAPVGVRHSPQEEPSAIALTFCLRRAGRPVVHRVTGAPAHVFRRLFVRRPRRAYARPCMRIRPRKRAGPIARSTATPHTSNHTRVLIDVHPVGREHSIWSSSKSKFLGP